MIQEEIFIKSTADGSLQPSLYFRAEGEGRPLIVGLHTWSYHRDNQINNLLPLAKEQNFNLLLPEFRGPNLKGNPSAQLACGSHTAQQDIKDAIDYILENESVDRDNVFLIGASGGGHMSMLMAGFCPEYFRAIAAFVPITSLAAWAEQNANYRGHVLHCCSESEEEMYDRSPVKYIDTIARANMKIFHGKYDNVVPVSQSVGFYNKMTEKYPQARIFLDIFDGGHQYEPELCRKWILSQYRAAKLTDVTG